MQLFKYLSKPSYPVYILLSRTSKGRSILRATMARTEITQACPSVALAQQSIPPTIPSLPSSEHVVTLSNAQEFIDIVKAIVAMQTASTPSPECTGPTHLLGNAQPTLLRNGMHTRSPGIANRETRQKWPRLATPNLPSFEGRHAT